MTNEEPTVPVTEHRNHWPTTVASLAVGAAFLALWFWLLPRWLGFRVEMEGAARWRWLAAGPTAALLVLLPGTARAGIVATDLRSVLVRRTAFEGSARVELTLLAEILVRFDQTRRH